MQAVNVQILNRIWVPTPLPDVSPNITRKMPSLLPLYLFHDVEGVCEPGKFDNIGNTLQEAAGSHQHHLTLLRACQRRSQGLTTRDSSHPATHDDHSVGHCKEGTARCPQAEQDTPECCASGAEDTKRLSTSGFR